MIIENLEKAELLITLRMKLRQSLARIKEQAKQEYEINGILFKEYEMKHLTQQDVFGSLDNCLNKWYTDIQKEISEQLKEL